MTNDNNHQACHIARLKDLRVLLTSLQLDGFLVPNNDAYQNENVPAHDRRLTWLTGFTGSMGMAVILSTRSALFVDGRYTLQASQEIDTASYDIQHIFNDPPMSSWIQSQMNKGERIGYDPWLHTKQAIDHLTQALSRSDIVLVACSDNPIDTLWESQPSVPVTDAIPYPIQFAGCTSEEKRLDLSQKLTNQSVDAMILTMPDTIAWLLNIRGNDVEYTPVSLSFAILYANGHVTWFIDPCKVTSATQHHLDAGVVIENIENFAQALDRLGQDNQRILIDPAVTPMWICDRLQKENAHIHQAPDPCALAKVSKNPTELEGIRAAHYRDGLAVVRFLYWLDTQIDPRIITEIDSAQYLFDLRYSGLYFHGNSFETISASGEHGAIVHYQTSEQSNCPLGTHYLYLIDSGGQYLDGTTDITRTVAILDPQVSQTIPEASRIHFTHVLKGHIALATLRFPTGTTGAQLDGFARQSLWQLGLDYDHATGHGVGCYLNVHERMSTISKFATTAIKENTIISNEPGYYQAGHYGIRIENLMATRPSQTEHNTKHSFLEFETLTLAPIDRRLILPDLLNVHERSWLNSYHRRVFDTLTPDLESSVVRWLEQVTAPL